LYRKNPHEQFIQDEADGFWNQPSYEPNEEASGGGIDQQLWIGELKGKKQKKKKKKKKIGKR